MKLTLRKPPLVKIVFDDCGRYDVRRRDQRGVWPIIKYDWVSEMLTYDKLQAEAKKKELEDAFK